MFCSVLKTDIDWYQWPRVSLVGVVGVPECLPVVPVAWLSRLFLLCLVDVPERLFLMPVTGAPEGLIGVPG